MKLVLTAILFMVCFSANALITAPYSSSVDNTGTVTYKDKVFIMVYGSSALSAGQVAVLDVANDNGVYAKPSSSALETPLCVAVEAIAAGAMGKCQVYGYNSQILFAHGATAATAGEPMYLDTGTAGYVKALGYSSVEPYYKSVGIFYDASAATGAVEAFIDTI